MRIRTRLRSPTLALGLVLWAMTASAQGGVNALVDRLSERIDPALAGAPERDDERPARAPDPGERATLTEAVLVSCDALEACRIRARARMPGKGPRLFLVDAGALFKAGEGTWVAVPNQRFVLSEPESTMEFVALPLRPGTPPPKAPNTPLKVVASNDAGVLAVLRTVQRIETEDVSRLRRYTKERDGAVVVDTFLDNEDVRIARTMTWSKDPSGQVEGKLPLEAIRFALYAVTAGHTLSNAADWYRTYKGLDMNPAIAAAGEVVRIVELLLERGGLNFRVYGPAWADHHFNRGVRAYRDSDLDAAEKSFRAALDRQADHVRAHYNLGVVLYRKGRYPDAEQALQIGIGIDGADASMFYNRGAALWRVGDLMGAARMFRQALVKNDRDPDAAPWLAKADPEDKTAPKAAPGKKGKKK